MKTNWQLYTIGQEITPLDPDSTLAGGIYRIAEYKLHNGKWYIRTDDLPARYDADGDLVIEWYDQVSVGPVLSVAALNELLLCITLADIYNEHPVIICSR